MLARREAIESAGFIDERFFMYSEETDFCHRIKSAGWSVRHFPWMTILHYGAKAGVDPRIESMSAYSRVRVRPQALRAGASRVVLRDPPPPAWAPGAARGSRRGCEAPPDGQPGGGQDAPAPLAPATLAVELVLGPPEAAVDIADPGAHDVIPHPEQLVQGAIPGSMMVLNFHCIGRPKREFADGEGDVHVDRQQFAEILDVVRGRSDVRLTFDDGNRSDVGEALPELVRRGLRAEFFICAGRLGTPEFLDEDDVRELRQAGMSVGSHGMDHVRWRRLDPAGIDREIVEAKQILEDALQAPVDAAACPFGSYDRRTLRALRAAGFECVYTSDGGRADSADWLIARNTVRRSDSAESIERMLDNSRETASLLRKGKGWVKQWR